MFQQPSMEAWDLRVEQQLLLLRVQFLLLPQAVAVAALGSAPFVRPYSLVQLVVLLSPCQVAGWTAQEIERARVTAVLALLELSGLENGRCLRQLTRVCADLEDEDASGLPSSNLVHA